MLTYCYTYTVCAIDNTCIVLPYCNTITFVFKYIMYCLYCNKLLNKDQHYGLHRECFKKAFGVENLTMFESFKRKDIVSANPNQNKSRHLTSFFVGNYRKYEAKLEGKSYIFKMGSIDYPELPAVEHLCNWIALTLELPAPIPFVLVKGRSENAFVTRNFMQEISGHKDLRHIYHFLQDGEEYYTVENIISILQEQTQSLTDIETFINTILYDALIGNNDRHGRNLAIIETAKGKKLSPIYDNVSALGIEKGDLLLADHNPQGNIWTKDSKEPGMKEYVKELRRLGYQELVDRFIRILQKKNFVKMISNAPGMSKEMKKAVITLVEKRKKELLDAN